MPKPEEDELHLLCMLVPAITAFLCAAGGRGREQELTIGLGVRSILVRRSPFRVRCIEGCIWITHDADPRDHVLGPGQVFTASCSGLLVLWAFEPSRLLVLGRGWRIRA
jgi:hypothetical protein